MPATPTSDTVLSQALFPDRSNVPAQAVAHQFATRPTLRQVAGRLLSASLLELYPTLPLDMAVTRLATPNQRGGWDLKLLLDVALDYLGNDTPLDFAGTVNERRHFLTNQPPQRLTYLADTPLEPSMQGVESKIRELASTLAIGLQNALSDYWNEADETGVNRWQWLGDLLATGLNSAASLLPDSHREHRAALYQLTRHPDRRERQLMHQAGDFVHAYCLETCWIKDGQSTSITSPDLLIVQGQHTLLYRIAGDLQCYPSMEDFTQAWGREMAGVMAADSVRIKRYEPDGNIFDTQAALLLDSQLQALEAIVLPSRQSVAALDTLIAASTDPSPYFVDAPAPAPQHLATLESSLPQWLLAASASDRSDYRQRMVELARVQRHNAGASFLDGIENLHDFTTQALHKQMSLDHADSDYDPAGLVLTFHVPVGDLGSGYLSPVSMDLTELAVKNLAGAPPGRLTLADRSGHTLPSWLTADYILGEKGLFSSTQGLISRTNIGQRYPEKIKQLLLSDSPESRRREALFAEDLSVRLPLQALEHKLRGEQGLTTQGARYVKALMHRAAPDRVVDGRDIVIRPLAFARKPGATPDIASNMFIIEPRDADQGPHLLYRPLYADSLREFATRQALFDAIAQPGALQDSVLSWLDDRARPIYSNDGFRSPHILRFGMGDDTVRWPAPEPAQLAVDSNDGELPGSLAQSLAAGSLAQYLYGSNARALVDLADRDTVSNTESRWAILLEGGWLLFNAVLMPLLRGPVMLAGWMLQVAVSLKHDIAGLQSDDADARELAWVDVLLNIGLIVLHVASRGQPSPAAPAHTAPPELALPLAALRRPVTPPAAPSTALIEQGIIGLPAEPVAGDTTRVDFVHSNARDASRRRLLDALRELHVPWPVPAPEPLDIGPYRGLYRIGQHWHASVGGLLLRVDIVSQTDEVFIIHPQKPLHPGFQLKTDGRGRWSLDLGLKLRGGGPKKRINSRLAQIQQQRTEAWAEADRIERQVSASNVKVLEFLDRILPAKAQLEASDEQLQQSLAALRAAPDDPAIIQAHAAKARERARFRVNFEVLFEQYEGAAGPQLQHRRDLLKAYQQIKVADGKFDLEAAALTQYPSMLAAVELRIAFLEALFRASFISDQGESLIELANTASDARAMRYVYDLLETKFASCERHAQAVINIEAILEELAGALNTGPAQRHTFLSEVPSRRFYNRLSATLDSLDLLTLLSIDLTFEASTAPEHYFLQNQQLLHSVEASLVNSHLDLLTTEGFTARERQEVLLNLIDHYSRRLQIYRTLTDLQSPLVMPRYMPLLIERLELVRSAAEADLAEVLREDEFLPAQVLAFKPVKIPAPRKRVFQSRDKGALVGELQAPDAGTPYATLVTRNPITQQVSGRFREHANEGWVEIVEAKPSRPVDPPAVRTLATLRTLGQRLLDEVPAIERSIEFQKRKLQDPQRRDDLSPRDWDDMLSYQAQRLEAIADEIEQQHRDNPPAAQTLEHLRQRASELRSQGRQHCIEGYKAQPPRQQNIAYLLAHEAVDIGLVQGPKRTAANDYVSEFAVRERNSVTVLWYAHFHYERADASPGAYTKAHLKRPEHRFITLKDLLAQAGTNYQAIARDLYNPISPPLDQRLFLSLLPA